MTFNDDLDDDLDFDEAETRSEVLRRARSEGALAAYESALEIAQDKTAPAVARASSQRTLLALAGLMDKVGRDDATNKPPSELTPEELAEGVARAIRDLGERSKARTPRNKPQRPATNDGGQGGGVFD